MLQSTNCLHVVVVVSKVNIQNIKWHMASMDCINYEASSRNSNYVLFYDEFYLIGRLFYFSVSKTKRMQMCELEEEWIFSIYLVVKLKYTLR